MHKTLHFPSSGPRLSKFQVQIHPSIWSSGRILQLSASWYIIPTCHPIGTQQPNHLVDTCVSSHVHWFSSLNAIPKIGQGIERLTEWVQRHYMLCLYQTNFAQVSWTTVVSTCSVISVVVETLRQLQHTTSSSSSPASNCLHFSITFASFSSDTAFSNVTFCYTYSSTCHCPSQEFRV